MGKHDLNCRNFHPPFSYSYSHVFHVLSTKSCDLMLKIVWGSKKLMLHYIAKKIVIKKAVSRPTFGVVILY